MADASSNVRPVTLQLIDAQGHILQEFFFAQEKIVIGRITSADLKIEDPTVSRVHALIEVHPDRISITDLASTHGTFLEGQKVLNGEIRPGQDFQIGKIKVHVKEGALDKVPVEFRESYRQATATPAFGTNLSDFTPTSVPVHEPKKPKKPTTETKRTTTPVPAPSHMLNHILRPKKKNQLKRRARRGRSGATLLKKLCVNTLTSWVEGSVFPLSCIGTKVCWMIQSSACLQWCALVSLLKMTT